MEDTSETDDADETAADETPDDVVAILDRKGRSIDQLPLAAFDESMSTSDVIREVLDAEQRRDDRLNAIGDSLAAIETIVDDEPMVDRDDWQSSPPEVKRALLEHRLDALVEEVAEVIDDDQEDSDAGDDGLRPETERSHVGYW